MPHRQGADEVRALGARLPEARHVFFVRNKGLEVARVGLAGLMARERLFYRTVTSDSYLIEEEGLVDAPGVTDADSLLLELQGMQFDDVVTMIGQCAVTAC